jgi:hypothetical protein
MMKRLLAVLGAHVENGARFVLLLLLSLAAVGFLIYQGQALSHPYPLDYGEAPLVDQAMRLAAGQNIYRPDISSPPYTISNYPPLYVLSLVPFVKVFGPNFLAGRVISSLCSLASGAFLALIIYAHTADRTAAIVTGLLFVAIPYVVHWSPLLRIDMLALACSTGGLNLLARWPTARWSAVASALLLVAAIYTRQSYALAAPLAAFVWLATHGWRRAVSLAALVGGLVLALFLALNALTQGGFFFNVVTANVNEFDTERLGWNLRQFRDAAPVLLLLGGVSLVVVPGRMRCWPLMVPYLIGGALSSLTIGKIGSNVNYFLELSAALSLAVGTLVAWSGRPHGRGLGQRPWLRAGLLILLALQTVRLMQTTMDEYFELLGSRLGFREELRELEGIVADVEGPVLADEYMGLVTLQGRPLYIQPFEVTQLAEAGLWDQTSLVEDIREKEFPLILIHYFPEYAAYKERWTPEMLFAVQRAYVPADSLANTLVYRPLGSRTRSRVCPSAPWQLPTNAEMGVQGRESGLDFFGQGNENSVPVYAVADGLLTRLSHWENAVAIQHDDPLRPGEKVWTYYAHMASASSTESYIVPGFPAGSANVSVKAGQLLGYQGRWSERAQTMVTTWVHLRFAVVRATEDDRFPDGIGPGDILDPSPYLGIMLKTERGHGDWQPLRCSEAGS